MLNRFKDALRRLRNSFSDKAEDAYAERDAAEPQSREEAYAQGKAWAYGDAEGEVRDAEVRDAEATD